MKTVRIKKSNFIFFLLLLFHLISCKKNNFIERIEENNASIINYDNDTVIYRIDVRDDNFENYTKETFYVIRNLYANNINLGSYNSKKEDKFKNDTINLYLKYSVFIEEKSELIKLWDIDTPNTDNIIYPILEQGIAVKEYYCKNDSKKNYINDFKILRIKCKRDAYQDFECLNFRINKNNKWTLISKEKLNTTIPEIKGYCIDTISKQLNIGEKNKNTIIFNQAFDDFECDWICN